jgi:hypothetical protein
MARRCSARASARSRRNSMARLMSIVRARTRLAASRNARSRFRSTRATCAARTRASSTATTRRASSLCIVATRAATAACRSARSRRRAARRSSRSIARMARRARFSSRSSFAAFFSSAFASSRRCRCCRRRRFLLRLALSLLSLSLMLLTFDHSKHRFETKRKIDRKIRTRRNVLLVLNVERCFQLRVFGSVPARACVNGPKQPTTSKAKAISMPTMTMLTTSTTTSTTNTLTSTLTFVSHPPTQHAIHHY